MRIYSTDQDNTISFKGDGDGVALRDHTTVSAQHMAEVLQQTYDAGRNSMLLEIQEDLANKRTKWP